MRKLLSAVASCVLLAGCGGDGNGSGGSLAGSSGSPTTSPSPTPTSSTASQNLLTLNTDQSLMGFAGGNNYYRDASGKVTDETQFGAGLGSPVTYIAASHSFAYSFSAYYLPKTVNVTASLTYNQSASSSGYSAYDAQPNGAMLTLRRLDIGSANPVLPLIYSNVAITKASYYDPSTGVTGYDVTPQAFGLIFKYDQARLTGNGVYSGVVLGQAEAKGGTHVYDISGTVDLSINYDATTFTGQLHLFATDDKTGQRFDLGTLPLKETVARGTLDSFLSKTTGQDFFKGQLMGPMGEEFIAGIDAHYTDPEMADVTLKISAVAAARK